MSMNILSAEDWEIEIIDLLYWKTLGSMSLHALSDQIIEPWPTGRTAGIASDLRRARISDRDAITSESWEFPPPPGGEVVP